MRRRFPRPRNSGPGSAAVRDPISAPSRSTARGQREPLCSQASDASRSGRGEEEGLSFSVALPPFPTAAWVQRGHLAAGPSAGETRWKILHDGVRYIEQGNETTPKATKRRAQRLAQALRKLGYAVTLSPVIPAAPADSQ